MKLLRIYNNPVSNEIKQLLQANVIGTPGQSLVYQHCRVFDKLKWIKDSTFVGIEIGGKPVGVCCFIDRKIKLQQNIISGFYIRYFSFKKQFRSVSDLTVRPNKKSILKNDIEELLSSDVLSSNPTIFYAYVDPDNIRSKRIIETYGFEEVGRFKTVYFSRFFPAIHKSCSVLKGELLAAYKECLKAEYKDYSFFIDDNIGFEDGAIGIVEDGEVVAALQANAERWRIYEMPGANWILDVLGNLPIINRLFGKDFRFMSVEGVYLKAGYEHLLPALLESALKIKERNTAILCLNKQTIQYRLMKGFFRGLIKYLSKEKEMAVVAKGKSLKVSCLAKNPVYISGFDNM